MATVASLICWGGNTGKTVASINTSTDALTITNHGLRNSLGVQFDSWTTPPTVTGGVALDTTYYAKYLSSSTFELYYDSGLTSKLDFTADGTSLVLKSAYRKGLTDTSRWGTRIYDGIAAWDAGRTGASEFDVEVAEIGEAFSEIVATDLVVAVLSAQNRIETKINGVRTAAFHGGNIGAALANLTLDHGYVFYATAATTSALRLTRQRDILDGISVVWAATTSRNMIDVGALCTAVDCLATCSAGNFGTGYYGRSAFAAVIGCVVAKASVGWSLASSQAGLTFVNNTIANCSTPISAVSTVVGYYYNNMVLGGWTTAPTSFKGSGNSGATGSTPWTSAGGTSTIVNTTDVADYANLDLRPASGSSPQVDAGVLVYGYPTLDVTGEIERPSYNNGGAEYIDIGAYEYDKGYGPHPATRTLTFDGVPAGTEIRITDVLGAAAVELAGVESSAANPSLTINYTGSGQSVWITIISLTGMLQQFLYSVPAVDTTIPMQMGTDRWYYNP